MEKIKQLLKAMGSTEEFSTELVGIIESHIKSTITGEKTRLQEEFDKKINSVKKVCVEEVESEKVRLSRGVHRFLTANLESVKRAGAKQLANEEIETVNKLKAIKALVEGINVDEAKANHDLQAAHGEVKALKTQLAESKTTVAALSTKVTKLVEVSNKSIARQKSLETQLSEAKKTTESVLKESKIDTVQKSVKTMNEERVKKATPVTVVTKPEETGKESVDNDIDKIASSI